MKFFSKMKFEIPQIQHSPFVTVDRFCEMTGLTKRQVRHLIDSGYLPAVRLTNSKQTTKSHFINLLQIQTKLLNASGDVSLTA